MKTRRSKPKVTIPLAIVAGMIPAINDVRANAPARGWLGAISHTSQALVGYNNDDKKWGMHMMAAAGTYPLVGGFIAHWAANKFGLNRMIARAGIPFVRI